MGNFKHFCKDTSLWEWLTQAVWGALDFCPSLLQFQVRDVTQSELSASPMQGHGGILRDPNVTWVLLIVLGRTFEGEMAFGLAMVWAHSHQACLSSLCEVARKLTLLIDIGDNWAYAFVWLNEGTLHVPLSNEGHISTMVDGVLSRSTCGHLHQLEVHKLLQSRDQVVCPKGLKWGLELYCFCSQNCLSGIWTPLVDPSTNLCCYRWASPMQCWETRCPPFQVPAEPQHHLPSPIQPWSVPVKQLTTSVWPLSFKSSYLGWCWTPPAQSQGTLPQGDEHQQPWVPHQPSEWKTCLGKKGQFWPCPSWWLPPSRCHCKQLCLMIPSQSAIWLSDPGIRNSWSSQCPYHPAIWGSSWDKLGHPLQWSTLATRGDEQGHGVTTYKQGVHRHLSQKAGTGHQNCLPSK